MRILTPRINMSNFEGQQSHSHTGLNYFENIQIIRSLNISGDSVAF